MFSQTNQLKTALNPLYKYVNTVNFIGCVCKMTYYLC